MYLCKFRDKENDVVRGGILDDDGNIICGCCGGLIPAEDIGVTDDCDHELLDAYDWIDMSKVILEEVEE